MVFAYYAHWDGMGHLFDYTINMLLCVPTQGHANGGFLFTCVICITALYINSRYFQRETQMLIKHHQKLNLKLLFVFVNIFAITIACSGGGGGSDTSNASPNGNSNDFQIDFTQTVLDHSQVQVLTLTNNGADESTFGSIAETNPLNAPFNIIDDQCSLKTLAPSETCTIEIQFSPTNQGSFDDSFDIPSNTGQTIMTVRVTSEAVAYNVSINQVDKSACPNIRLNVSVTDLQDDPVTILIQNDFSIFENGLLQQIVSLSNVATPISVAIALDYSGSMQPYIADVESAAKGFLDLFDLNNGTDEAEIIKFGEDIETTQAFTDDNNLLRVGIDENYSGGTDETHLYDTLWQAIESASVSTINDRRAVVVVTDGIDEGSVNHQLADVVEKANESGVPVFTIGLGNVYISALQKLADETGGQYFLAPDSTDLESIYQSILDLLANQYIIEYVSPSSGGGDMVDLDVEVDQSGLKGNDSKSVTGC